MTWLFEDTLLLVVLGVILAIVLCIVWLQTGRRFLLLGAAACLALTTLCVFVERWVVTDREAVETTLYSAAAAVQNNDLAELLQHVHSGAPQIRQQATAEFPRYTFESVDIKSNLQIDFDQPRNPVAATARFNVMVAGSDKGTIGRFRVPRFVVVRFRKEDGAWRVFEYEHHEYMEGFRKPRGE